MRKQETFVIKSVEVPICWSRQLWDQNSRVLGIIKILSSGFNNIT